MDKEILRGKYTSAIIFKTNNPHNNIDQYARLNRLIISEEIIKGMKWKADNTWSCPHNYVSFDNETVSSFGSPMLRKGAISAPHGAGRIMKREDIKNNFTLSSFKKEMKC